MDNLEQIKSLIFFPLGFPWGSQRFLKGMHSKLEKEFGKIKQNLCGLLVLPTPFVFPYHSHRLSPCFDPHCLI